MTNTTNLQIGNLWTCASALIEFDRKKANEGYLKCIYCLKIFLTDIITVRAAVHPGDNSVSENIDSFINS